MNKPSEWRHPLVVDVDHPHEHDLVQGIHNVYSDEDIASRETKPELVESDETKVKKHSCEKNKNIPPQLVLVCEARRLLRSQPAEHVPSIQLAPSPAHE